MARARHRPARPPPRLVLPVVQPGAETPKGCPWCECDPCWLDCAERHDPAKRPSAAGLYAQYEQALTERLRYWHAEKPHFTRMDLAYVLDIDCDLLDRLARRARILIRRNPGRKSSFPRATREKIITLRAGGKKPAVVASELNVPRRYVTMVYGDHLKRQRMRTAGSESHP